MQNFEAPAESFANPRIQKTKPYFDPPENDEIASTPPPAREGLPPSYKMRADPHYVDLLAARPRAAANASCQSTRSMRRR